MNGPRILRILCVGDFVSAPYAFSDQTPRDERTLSFAVERLRREIGHHAARINRDGPGGPFDLETAQRGSEYRDWHEAPPRTDALMRPLERVGGRRGQAAYLAAFRFNVNADFDLFAVSVYVPDPMEGMVFFEIVREPDVARRIDALVDDKATFDRLIRRARAALAS